MCTESIIIARYNESINNISKAYSFSKNGKLSEAQTEMINSSTATYEVFEWSLKRIILDHKLIDKTNPFVKNLLNKGNTKNIVDFLNEYIQPKFSFANIDVNKILSYKSIVRNQPEHNGHIPYFNHLLLINKEVRKIILKYIDETAELKDIPNPLSESDIVTDYGWDEFEAACDKFTSLKDYILIIGKNYNFSNDKLELLGLIDWKLIIDFDQESESLGFLKYAKEEIQKTKTIHHITINDDYNISSKNALYWLAAQGMMGRSTSITNDHRTWNRKNKSYISKFVRDFFKTYSDKLLNVVILYENPLYVKSIIDILDELNGPNIKYIFATPTKNTIEEISNIYSGYYVNISIPKICDGILKIRSKFDLTNFRAQFDLPAKDQEYVVIDNKTKVWLSEDLEVIYRNMVDLDINLDYFLEKEQFYKGYPITWTGIELNNDIIRTKSHEIKRKIDRSLKDRIPTKIALNHTPGSGGTTVGRRISYDFRIQNPTVILKFYRASDTINRIYKIFEETKLSVLVLCDNSNINKEDINKLFDEAQSRSIPSVFFVISRVDSRKNNDGLFLNETLDDSEFNNFIIKYSEIVPEKKQTFINLKNSTDINIKHPFYLGLVAFEADFRGLENYVAYHLSDLNKIQKNIITLMSFCYYYAQKGMSAQLFSSIVESHEHTIVRLNEHLSQNALSLFINEEGLNWRPRHYLIAHEILKQTCQNDNITFQLSTLSIDLIQLISSYSVILSNQDNELLRRLFVYRNNEELISDEDESNFSALIEDLPTDEAKLLVLQKLAQEFPFEAHFHAHLSRFYSIKLKKHNDAYNSINIAIEVSDGNDSLLYHMKGMCIKNIIYDKINSYRNTQNVRFDHDIETLVLEAGDCFQKSRELNPNNEHGYISHIHLLISYIDFGFKISNFTNKMEYLKNMLAIYQDKLNLAEDLLGEIKMKRRNNSTYFDQCNIKLKALYENHTDVIQGWHNLLSRNPSNRNAIRRSIVNVYKRRAEYNNSPLTIEEVKKCFH